MMVSSWRMRLFRIESNDKMSAVLTQASLLLLFDGCCCAVPLMMDSDSVVLME